MRLFSAEALQHLIQIGGFPIIAAMIFAETGLLVGFFLPGDSLLFTAGIGISIGFLKPPAFLPQEPAAAIVMLDVLLMLAAFLGNSTGYWIGSKTGPPLFSRPNSRLFKREHLLKTQAFYEKHGPKTIILAEFMPFARTFAPVVAGVAQMNYRRFMTFNLVGVVVWINTMLWAGYLLGQLEFPFGGYPFKLREHIDAVCILIVLVSVLPAFVHVIKERRSSAKGGS